MGTDVAQNTAEAVKNMERDTLQDTKELKVTKNIDIVATQNMEEQSDAIKQQVKQGINDNTIRRCVKTLSIATMQLRNSKELIQKLLDKNQNLEKRIQDLSTQVLQLQAKIKNMTKNIDKVVTQNVEEQSNAIKQQVKQGIDRIDDNFMQFRIERQLNLKVLDKKQNLVEKNQKQLDKNKNLEERNQDLSTQVSQLQAEIKNMTKNKHKEAKTIAIAALRKISRIPNLSSEDIARAVSLL